MPRREHHVVVVGGGFAGLNACTALARSGFRVTLVDRHPYTTFQPLLYQVATGGLNPGDITHALRSFASKQQLARVSFRRATVTGIDTEARTVQVSQGSDIGYDSLVLAPGVGANFFGIEGAAENVHTIYTRGAALATRDAIYSGLERLAALGDPDRRFTVAVVGGGATGVEMAGTLAELKSEGLPVIYPELRTDNFRVVLVEMAPDLLGPFEPHLRDYAVRELTKRGVDVRLRTTITKVSRDGLDFGDGAHLDTDVVVWAAGVGAHDVVAAWGVPQGRGGRILVTPELTVKGHDDVFAVGDAALVEDAPLPQLAQPAIQMGKHVARQIRARVDGEPLEPFSYSDLGTMATIGRNAAVVQFPSRDDRRPVTLKGFPAWSLWVGVHLRQLLGGRNRVQAMINLGARYLSWPRSAAGILGDVTEDE